MSNRHNFLESTKEDIRIKSGYICNNPACRKLLWNPKSQNRFTGRIAHIIAASPNGPRSSSKHQNDKSLISSHANGLVLCDSCETMIDLDSEVYTVELLQKWKADTEAIFSIYQSENFPVLLTQESRTIYRDNPGVTKKYEKRIESLEIFIKSLQQKISSEFAKIKQLNSITVNMENAIQHLQITLDEERHKNTILADQYNKFKAEVHNSLSNRLGTQVSSLFSIFSSDKESSAVQSDPSMFLFTSH